MSFRMRTTFSNSRFWSRVSACVHPPCKTPCRRQARTYASQATALEKLISDSIRATGPISVSQYTQLCLSHPTEGYYMKQRPDGKDVFGVNGDFITSPEISQVFGELVGLWLLSQWLYSGDDATRKPKVRLIELGPGRGTLMDDVLRTFCHWPLVKEALSAVHLVETSPAMTSRQEEKLSHWFDNTRSQLHNFSSIEDVRPGLDDEFTMIIAHEFFDALPVHILETAPDGFREVLIDLHHPPNNTPVTGSTRRSPFRFVLSPTPTVRSDLLGDISPRFSQLPPGTRLEVSDTGWRIARKMGELISHTGHKSKDGPNFNATVVPSGAGLIIDYGDDHVSSSSFRAFKNHRLVDVFETPGMCDLTTNVDFTLLKEGLKGVATTHGPLSQSEFLLRMGIETRLSILAEQAQNEKHRREIDRAGKRLVDTSGQGMGAAYRVLGITSMSGRDGQNDTAWPFVDEF